MSKKLNVKEILVPTISLFLICLIATALLAFTNQVTVPLIDQRSAQAEDATKKVVLADATSFSDGKTVVMEQQEYSYFEGLDASGNVIGYIFITTSKGYGGDIKVMTGVNLKGVVQGVQTLVINETAGLGMNAADHAFLDQYIGKGEKISVSKNSPKDNEIQALTGATITSKAVTDTVNTALSLFNVVTGGGTND